MTQSHDDDHNSLETRIAVHEAVCAERYGKTFARVARGGIVLYVIVALLLVGEGSATDVLRRIHP